MAQKEQLKERLRQWAAFAAWESQLPAMDRPAGEIVADLGSIWEWLPPGVRGEDPDPEKRGVGIMRAALARLKSA